jgi:hypothetical protein
VAVEDLPELRQSLATAVGHDPETAPVVGSSKVERSKIRPFNIVPETVKVFEDDSEAPLSEPGNVLEEQDRRHAHCDDSDDPWPQPPVVVEPLPLSGDAERLTRESCSEAIHDSIPWRSVEGPQVGPDRCRIQPLLGHESCQLAGSNNIPLHVTDGGHFGTDCKTKPEFESAVPGT